MTALLSNSEFQENTPKCDLGVNLTAPFNECMPKKIIRDPPKIHYSTDYNFFEPHDLQRKLQERNLKRLRKSIERHNLLHENPIIVLKPQGEVSETNRYKVVNGNHRFTISMEKQLGVYFIIADNFQLNDIVDTGYCLAKWTTPQFCEFYCKLGNQEYIKFKKFHEDFKIDICTALPLTKRPSERKALSEIFRDGKFVFDHEQERRREVDKACVFLNKCIEFALAPKLFFSNSAFFDAYIKLTKHPDFDEKKIMEHFTKKTITLPKIAQFSSNIEFYNFLKQFYMKIDPKTEFKQDI